MDSFLLYLSLEGGGSGEWVGRTFTKGRLQPAQARLLRVPLCHGWQRGPPGNGRRASRLLNPSHTIKCRCNGLAGPLMCVCNICILYNAIVHTQEEAGGKSFHVSNWLDVVWMSVPGEIVPRWFIVWSGLTGQKLGINSSIQ